MKKIYLVLSVISLMWGGTVSVQAASYSKSLYKSIRAADLISVKKAIDEGEDVNQKDYKGTTPLMRAASFGHTELVRLLLQKGAKVNSRDNDGDSPLKHAAWSDKVEIVDMLVAKGADLEAKNKLGTTPIWSAVITGRVAIVKRLIEHGANPNTPNQYGMSAIRFARSRDEWELVKFLQSKDAKDF